MAIVPLDKITVYGMQIQKAEVLDDLQRLGCLHLVNLTNGRAQAPELISKEAREALGFLTTCPMLRRPTKRRRDYDREALIHEALEIKEQRDKLTQERDYLQKAVADLQPWGEFHLPPANELRGLRFWFYVLPPQDLAELAKTDLSWTVVRQDAKEVYVVVVGSEQPALPVRPVELDRRPRSQLLARMEQIDEELDELHWRRVTLTRWRMLLKTEMDEADDRAARIAAEKDALDVDRLFALQGWVPRVATAEVEATARKHKLAVTIEPPAPTDEPPTLLKNPEPLAGGEGCVTFYITPAYRAWDPSQVVFFSFSLFFAMIVADAGYGLLMAAIVLLFAKKMGQSRTGIHYRNLFLSISLFTVLYGVLLGSYFGITPNPDSYPGRLMLRVNGKPLMDDANRNLMMVIAVTIGVLHLSLANIITSWRRKGIFQALGPFGWVLLMIGGLLIGTGIMVEIELEKTIGMSMIVVGLAFVLLFSSNRPLFTLNPLEHLRRLADGLLSMTNLTKAFGDALSYLRLFALGLASAQLSLTFNELAVQTSEIRGVGVLVALVILLVGHGINFLLALMSGVVHGLRLNCIEFFNWSLTDEGYPFQPLRKKAET